MKYARMFGWIWLWIWMNDANIENSNCNAWKTWRMWKKWRKKHIFYVIVGLFISFRSDFFHSLSERAPGHWLWILHVVSPSIHAFAVVITIFNELWTTFLFYLWFEITRNASAKNENGERKINIELNSIQHKLKWHNYAQCCRSVDLIDRHKIYFVLRASAKNWK